MAETNQCKYHWIQDKSVLKSHSPDPTALLLYSCIISDEIEKENTDEGEEIWDLDE